MKIFTLLVCLSLLARSVNGQIPYDSVTNLIVYTDIVHLENLNSKEIYDKAKVWILSTLKTGDEMTELNDETNSLLVGTGNIKLKDFVHDLRIVKMYHQNCILNFKVMIQIKDGRYKYTISNFAFSSTIVVPNSGSRTFISPLEFLKVNESKKENFIKYEQEFNSDVKEEADKQIRILINSLKSNIENQEEEW